MKVKEGMMSEDLNLRRNAHRLTQALGPKLSDALVDPNVNEIMLNPDGKLFFEIFKEGMREAGFMDVSQSITLIRTAASILNQDLDRDRPIVSGELPYDGSRFEALLPPLTKAPCFCIRKHNSQNSSLADLLDEGLLNKKQLQLLTFALTSRQSLLIAGATGCGKTTLINALLNELSTLNPKERVILIEDTRELNLNLKNQVSLLSNNKASMCDLLRSTLRMRPDRLVIGEVRGAEALYLIDALSTGHQGGIASIHAGSISQSLKRLSLLISRHPSCPKFIEPTIAEALDLVILLKNNPYRHIETIAKVEGFDGQNFIFSVL